MNVTWELGRPELLVFKALCCSSKRESGKSLAFLTGLPESGVSRALKALSEKKLVAVNREGKRNSVEVSDAPHALALKALFASRPYVKLNVLTHSGIRVLSCLLFPNASVARVKKLGFLPEITARRVLSKLLDAGAVGRRSPTDYYILMPELEKAVGEYVSFAVLQVQQGASGSLIARGPLGFLRTNSESVPDFMKPTGLSVLNEFGVKIIQTDLRDYYYNVFGKVNKPSLEDAVVHALIRSALQPSAREASYAALALYKNRKKLNEKTFLIAAADFGVEPAARQALDFVKAFAAGSEEKRSAEDEFVRADVPVFPSFKEFKELVKQYG